MTNGNGKRDYSITRTNQNWIYSPDPETDSELGNIAYHSTIKLLDEIDDAHADLVNNSKRGRAA
jgi:hypothetical protein